MREVFSQALGLPPAAVQWLLDLWVVIQTFDDVVDGDQPTRENMRHAILLSLVNMPGNPFFLSNAHTLLPLMTTAVLKWVASDDAERAGEASEQSYMWRAAYYDIVLMVVLLCRGPEYAMGAAKQVLSLYGEPFEAYRKEFENA